MLVKFKCWCTLKGDAVERFLHVSIKMDERAWQALGVVQGALCRVTSTIKRVTCESKSQHICSSLKHAFFFLLTC